MKILWLSAYSPWPADHGGKIRLFNLVKQMLARGHTIELWCVCTEEVQWSGSPPPGLVLKHFPQRERTSLRAKLEALVSPFPEPAWAVTTSELAAALASLDRAKPDAVIFEQPHVGTMAGALHERSIPYVLDAQNVEWWLAKQIAASQTRLSTRTRFWLDARKYRRLEADLVRSSAAVMAVSNQDAERLRELASPRSMTVRPSGVDTDFFEWVDHSALRDTRLLLTGTLGYAPNLDACQWMRSEIMPAVRLLLPSAQVDLVGRSAEAAMGLDAPDEGVNVIGPVPDVRPYMSRSDVFVVPLRMGSGTRLKVLEALAAGLPVVSTSIAAEGLDIPDDAILIGDTVDAIASHIGSVIGDLELRRRLSIAGRRYVEGHFSWRDIAAGVEETLREAVEPGWKA